MAVEKILARGWTFAVNTGTEQTPVWTEIAGITLHSWQGNTNRADTTTYDEAGWSSDLVTRRGLTLSLEAFYLEDTADGSRDPGQDAVDTAARLVGGSAELGVQVTSPGGNVVEGTCSVDANVSEGGGVDDPTGWSAEFAFIGAPTFTPAV